MTPEQDLLLRSLGGASWRARGRANAVDGARFLRTASPYLYPYLDRCFRADGGDVPPDLRRRCARAFRANAVLHLRRLHAFRRALVALERAAIPVVTLKGMALAELVYPHPATRPMNDIDLLVPVDASTRARQALGAGGFQVPRRHAVRPRSGPTAIASEALKPLEWPGASVMIDLHTALESAEPPFRFTTEAAWERSVPVRLAGLSARVLHRDDFLVHLAIHVSQGHRFDYGLRSLLDIHLLIGHHERDWDWPALARACRARGHAAWMYLTLALTRDLLGTPIPDDFFAALPAPARLAEAEALAREQIWQPNEPRATPGLVQWLATPGRGSTAAWLLRRANPWRRDEAGARLTPAGVARGALLGLRRLAVDAAGRGPSLVRAWRRGAFSGPRIGAAVRLHRDRERLAELLAADDP